MEATRTFFPVGRHSHQSILKESQRYRHPFKDLRLSRRYLRTLARMKVSRSGKAHHLSSSRSERTAIYRFLSNERVTLAELITHTTQVEASSVRGRDLLCLLDACSISLGLDSRNEVRKGWSVECGVIGNNQTTGFNIMPSLLVDHSNGDCLGLGDLLFYSRPLTLLGKKENAARSKIRQSLDIEHKESASWLYAARNTADQLDSALRYTFVMDQGGDQYEVIQRILAQTKGEIIVRAKVDRQSKDLDRQRYGKMSFHLREQDLLDTRPVVLRTLNHYSKSSGKMVYRQGRIAQMELRFIRIELDRPQHLNPEMAAIERPLYLVEAKENSSTVPVGEKPIHWKLLTTWEVDAASSAWEVVEAYRSRWHIEQLFRVLKKSGVNIEKAQLNDPEKIKKLLVMALKASADAIRLTQVRAGQSFVPITELFDQPTRQVLGKLNTELSYQGTKVVNEHDPESLAWASWVVARLGGWDGYQSQRPPGPITMQRGLQELDRARFYAGIFKGP